MFFNSFQYFFPNIVFARNTDIDEFLLRFKIPQDLALSHFLYVVIHFVLLLFIFLRLQETVNLALVESEEFLQV